MTSKLKRIAAKSDNNDSNHSRNKLAIASILCIFSFFTGYILGRNSTSSIEPADITSAMPESKKSTEDITAIVEKKIKEMAEVKLKKVKKENEGLEFYTLLSGDNKKISKKKEPFTKAKSQVSLKEITTANKIHRKSSVKKGIIKPIDKPFTEGISSHQKKSSSLPNSKKIKSAYTIQLAAFRNKKDALKLLSRLSSQGMKAYIVTANLSGKGLFYRVRYGNYKDKEKANHNASMIAKGKSKQLGLSRPMVMKLP